MFLLISLLDSVCGVYLEQELRYITKIYQNIAILIHLHIAYGCFYTKWQTWEVATQDFMACKT